ncbi:MAG: glycosyltransferase family 4 protein [Sulfuricellaceae bacterium]|nr:glycosyltransferase family 4 protein [Sulfuricellaceae bacterium]
MSEWLPPVLTAFLVSFWLLFWLLRLRIALPLDHPNQRSLHALPVPRIGGLGFLAGIGASLFWARPAGLDALLLLALALAVLSWVDDWRGLSVRVRLPFHFAAAGLLVATSGLTDGLIAWPGLFALTLAVVWMTNLYNFMDGADGLAGGMTVSGFAVYAGAAWLGGDADLARITGAIAAAGAGFLCFNFPPARLFLGDVGAIPLGFLAAALGLEGWRRGLWSPALPVLAFAPFIIDAGVTLLRRLLRGENAGQAHREHYYQRLVRMGWSHRRLLIAVYPLMLVSAISAVWMAHSPGWQTTLITIWGGLYVWGLAWVDRRWRGRVEN